MFRNLLSLPMPRPLSALLSQVLVAFTLELDNEFERRMQQAGHQGAGLSLVVWLNLFRFLKTGAVSVRELCQQSLANEARLKYQLGCLERWHFVILTQAGVEPLLREHRQSRRLSRDGWGSARGIKADWHVHLSARGVDAGLIWASLIPDIEARWTLRFTSREILALKAS